MSDRSYPPVMILCGGKGTRLRDVTELLPKPMVPIGEQPIVWHIMRSYAAFGVRRFILCLGYKRECFVDYFLNFRGRSSDVTIRLGQEESVCYHDVMSEEGWEVTLANTGIESATGPRIWRGSKYLRENDDCFFLTYGDGVADIRVADQLRFHRESGRLLTVTAVHPEGRFGEMHLDDMAVRAFNEKPAQIDGYINGGFMVVQRELLNRYMSAETTDYFEQSAMQRAVSENQVAAFRHEGFWQCMDTPREFALLNRLWEGGQAPWTRYW